MEESERVLVIRAQQGRSDAFARLMARHERPLLYYLRRHVGDLERARDISQEVWLTVWRSLPRLVDPAAFRSWLYRIAHRRAALLFRHQKDYERTNEPLVEGEPVDFDPGRGLEIADLQRAIDQLPPLQRAVIVLHHIVELPVEETAAALGCPVGTVKSRLFHARTELKRLLRQETNDEQ
jgi:RNA polymerase sigma-70 factor (ECF subfamily)